MLCTVLKIDHDELQTILALIQHDNTQVKYTWVKNIKLTLKFKMAQGIRMGLRYGLKFVCLLWCVLLKLMKLALKTHTHIHVCVCT